MDSVDIEVLRTAEAWRKQGRRVALGTIVKTWGSAPRPVGAMVAIRDDGQVVGSVSGGCVEDDLIDKVKARVVAATKPELVTYGVDRKSTRLNSSHGYISYAVFCLKKKKSNDSSSVRIQEGRR